MNKNNGRGSKAIRVVAGILVLLGSCAGAAVYSGGAGTEPNPYRIGSVADWTTLAITTADWNKHFILVNNIDFASVEVTPVGTFDLPFKGVFDGNGHALRSVLINFPETEYIGLFCTLGVGGVIKDLGVEDVDITGNKHVGGLVGYNGGGMITSCYVTGAVKGETAEIGIINIGGLVGYNNDGEIESCHTACAVAGDFGSNYVGGLVGTIAKGTVSWCYAAGTVQGTHEVGGLVGHNNEGTITSCCVTGSTGGATSVGGLVGYNNNMGAISRCYAEGAVSAGGSIAGGLVGQNKGRLTSCYARGATSGYNDVGGLVGYNYGGTVTYSYSTGVVANTEGNIGGLVGANDSGTVTSSYWDTDLSGWTTSAGGTGRTTDEMTYPYAVNTYVGWDFTTIWASDADYSMNDGYPFLSDCVVPAEGEGEHEEGEVSEGESEPNEGETSEGEGSEGEGEHDEGETSEGEGSEGEGETTEGEDEDEACGCCQSMEEDRTPREQLERTLGDWLLIGLSLSALCLFANSQK
ncbi:MAG: hypothetical protein GXY07_06705 [Candidatus Hydrogenedentes bacterium]|nr:hypothetical protein [Candidatus Hydrogenedentota bacterium]